MFINEKQKHLLELDAKANGIARVSVWLYNAEKDVITSQVIFSLDQNDFIPGLSLSRKDFPNYFKALEGNRIIDAHDAFNDERTKEFTDVYLKPLKIVSLLDIPILIGNHVIGVLCHEHIGETRVWTDKEILYSMSIADLFALAIETAEKDEIYKNLLDRERQLNFAINAFPVFFWTTDINLKFTSTNGNVIKKLRFNPKMIDKALTLYEFFRTNEANHPAILNHNEALKGKSVKFEYTHAGYVFESYLEPIKNSDLKIIGVTGIALNITERKRVEKKLLASEERFRMLAETANVIPWEVEVDTMNCTYVGPQAEKVLGYPAEEWLSPTFWVDHLHPNDRDYANNYFSQSFKTKKNFEYEYRMIAKNGNFVWFQDVVTVEYKNNAPAYLRGFLIDITSIKLVEEKIHRLNNELEQRVEERTAELVSTNKELEIAKIHAEELRVTKELFLASMSHEIRTPLNAIIGFQQLLKESNLTEEQKEYVESIDFAGKNLLVIINDVLDLAKIESGKLTFEEVEINISNIVHSVTELVEHRAKEKGIKLFFSHDSTIPKLLYGDSTRISQILLNLVGNAIKFTERGEVRIITHLVDENEHFANCEISVEDTGIGIAKDKIPVIFESFSQESDATTRKFGGTGLGLTISKHLVELQGGKIVVESERGIGSTFKVYLKIKKTSNKHQVDFNDKANKNDVLSHRKLKVLLAEDVILNQRLVVKIMEKWEHDLDIADNGKIAVDMVFRNQYDIILMDIHMPVMDGYQATALIRSMPDLKKQSIPIIALTAYASHAEAEKCINLGMNAYIAKPFNKQNLLATINQLTQNKIGV